MTKLKNFLNEMGERKFTFSNGKVQQTERNALKKDFLDILKETMIDNGFDVERTDEGVVIVLESNRVIFIALNAVVKNLDYDIEFEVAEYENKLAKQVERENERKKKTNNK